MPLFAEPAFVALFAAALVLLFMTKIDALLILAEGAIVSVGLHLIGVPLA